jgi:putative Mg2+ transporter-C (MgtC) family protein
MLGDIDLSFVTVLWRAGLAALLGFAIGWERRAIGSPVRARIIALVSLTTAALTALSLQMSVSDMSRVLAGLLTGIGFIGAGVVMRDSTGEVRGMTTAASLWAMTAVAIAIGAGYLILGILLTLLVYVVIAWDDWPLITRLRQRRAAQKTRDAASQQQAENPHLPRLDVDGQSHYARRES